MLIFRITIIKTTFFMTVANDLTEEGERVKKITFLGFFSLIALILRPVGFMI